MQKTIVVLTVWVLALAAVAQADEVVVTFQAGTDGWRVFSGGGAQVGGHDTFPNWTLRRGDGGAGPGGHPYLFLNDAGVPNILRFADEVPNYAGIELFANWNVKDIALGDVTASAPGDDAVVLRDNGLTWVGVVDSSVFPPDLRIVAGWESQPAWGWSPRVIATGNTHDAHPLDELLVGIHKLNNDRGSVRIMRLDESDQIGGVTATNDIEANIIDVAAGDLLGDSQDEAVVALNRGPGTNFPGSDGIRIYNVGQDQLGGVERPLADDAWDVVAVTVGDFLANPGNEIGYIADTDASGTADVVRFMAADGTDLGGFAPGLDMVDITMIPEPVTLGLLAAGGCVALARRRRR